MPIARRKKEVSIDGADFVISPLTYRQNEDYVTMVRDYNKKNEGLDKDKPLSEEQLQELRRITFHVLRSGLSELQVEDKDLELEMDDVLAAKLFREILEFTGMHVPTPEEIEKAKEDRKRKEAIGVVEDVGELTASS